jgi:hypothetical protein
MPCIVDVLDDGSLLFCCGEGLDDIRCSVCSSWADVLCDWHLDLPRSRTCDAPLCRIHALHVEAEVDYCPAHAYRLVHANTYEAP